MHIAFGKFRLSAVFDTLHYNIYPSAVLTHCVQDILTVCYSFGYAAFEEGAINCKNIGCIVAGALNSARSHGLPGAIY